MKIPQRLQEQIQREREQLLNENQKIKQQGKDFSTYKANANKLAGMTRVLTMLENYTPLYVDERKW